MERKTKFAEGEHYHAYDRGVEKRKIFLNKKDYDRFLALLYIMNQKDSFQFGNFLKSNKIQDIFNEKREKTLVSILGYCLMPNHFHLILYEKEENGISKFMLKLLTAYSMYFNKKYERSGPLFVRPFRSQHIIQENQYLYLFSYVHLNPIDLIEAGWKENGLKNKNKVKKFLDSYSYSSYLDFNQEKRPESNIIDFSLLPDYVIQAGLDFDDYEKTQKKKL